MSANRLDQAFESLLRPGETCWRASLAERATLLVDGQEYFAALRSALLRARKLIVIAGWDFDTRVHLPPRAAARGESLSAPVQFGELLGYLLQTRPGLQIHVARWNYHWLYRDDRETDTRQQLESRGIRFYEDSNHPTTGCVHHKVVVIDDKLAFIGGIDLTHNRWDTREHLPGEARRHNADGEAYMPVHDTQLCVTGPVVADIAAYLRENWPEGPPPERVNVPENCWPEGWPVHFEHINAAVSRTLPACESRPAIREVEAFYLAAIARTQRSLYLENQYFTSTRIAEAIAQRCREVPELQGLLVGMERPKTTVELHTMGHGLQRFFRILTATGASDRVPLVGALCDGQGINLHSKLGVFDDRWLTVGSANLNRRSMGFDVECNLLLEATTPGHRARMSELRNDLLAEHLGSTSNAIATHLSSKGLASLPDLGRGRRRLVRLRPDTLAAHFGPLLVPLFDRDCHLIPPARIRTAPKSRVAVPQRAAVALLAIGSLAAWWDNAPPLHTLTRSVDAVLGEVIHQLQIEAAASLLPKTKPQPVHAHQPGTGCDRSCAATREESS
ncbi:MAG TPA: phospholipase D-like domain-containing protein [Steroidobacter sp.]|uniref:phospholipase D-like domain-containing protein n=1 Tax=Steroidobacter sp. TaxID=1978227 RepID=UPI002ED8F59B